jgi:arylsulfatase A-like enzyme
MAAAGYETAVVSDFSGEIFSRLDAGFALRRVPFFDMKVVLAQAGWNMHPALFPFVASSLGHRVFPALAAAAENADPDRLADEVIATLDDVSGHGPFFLTAFFSAPHFPYAAPDPYYRRFTSPDYRGPFRYHKPVAAFDKSDTVLNDADVKQVRGLYDGAVASVDDAIGRVLKALRSRGLDRDTIVVVLADHGENLFDTVHGMGHGEHLRGDAALHIPLVIYDPVHEFPAHTVPGLVRDIDLAPTLAALAGVPLGDQPAIDGVDLAPLLRAERDTLDLHAFAESELWLVSDGPGFGPEERLPYPALPQLVTVAPDDDIVINPAFEPLTLAARHRAVRTDRWKLLYIPTRNSVRIELYDVVADPMEKTDVALQHPDVVAQLRPELERYMTLDGSTLQAGFAVPAR